jgi:hypothetical protein
VFYIFMVFFYLVLGLIMLVPLLGVWLSIKRMAHAQKTFILVAMATLLLTPSWGPATIAVVPVPFGVLFFLTLMTWSWNELGSWLAMFPVWHAMAFPATACASYLLIQKLLSVQAKTKRSSHP